MTLYKTFLFSAQGQREWTVEQDCVVIGLQGNGPCIVSSDPDMTQTRLSNVTEDSDFDQLIIGTFYAGNLQFELKKGMKLLATADSASCLQLVLGVVPSAEIA